MSQRPSNVFEDLPYDVIVNLANSIEPALRCSQILAFKGSHMYIIKSRNLDPAKIPNNVLHGKPDRVVGVITNHTGAQDAVEFVDLPLRYKE